MSSLDSYVSTPNLVVEREMPESRYVSHMRVSGPERLSSAPLPTGWCVLCPSQVRVRNLTYQQPFSPPLVVAHTNVSSCSINSLVLFLFFYL